MAKRDKDHELRMHTMKYCYELVMEKGVEALGAEIRKRGITQLPLYVKTEKIDQIWLNIKEGLKNNFLHLVLWILHTDCKFGKKRLTQFFETFNGALEASFDLDYMGEHYVRLEDFAIEIKEKFNFDIDIEKIAATTAITDERNPNYHFLKVEEVIKNLRESGYGDAADFLQAKID